MLIYIIRHGETNFNLEGRYQGMWIESTLTDTGRAQARAASPLYRDIPFSRIYVSPSARTRETASLLFPNRTDFIFRDDIRETDVGTIAGKLIADVRERYGEKYLLLQKTRDYSLFDGESPKVLLARAKNAMASILAEGEADAIALVTHGGIARTLVAALTGIDPYAIALLPNCSSAIVEYKNGEGILKEYGLTSTRADSAEAL